MKWFSYVLVLIAVAAAPLPARAKQAHFRGYEGRTYGTFRHNYVRPSSESSRAPVRGWTTMPEPTNVRGPTASFGAEGWEAAEGDIQMVLPEGVETFRAGGNTYYRVDGATYRPVFYLGQVAYIRADPPPDASSPDRDGGDGPGGYSLDEVHADGPPRYDLSAPPPGAIVRELPADSRPMEIHGTMYYRWGATWFVKTNRLDRVLYLVVEDPTS